MNTTQREKKRIPERTCIGCHSKRNKKELLRIVCSPDGVITMDHGQRLPGRGAYVCNDVSCMEMVIKKHALNRVFRREINRDNYKKLEEQFVEGNTAG